MQYDLVKWYMVIQYNHHFYADYFTQNGNIVPTHLAGVEKD